MIEIFFLIKSPRLSPGGRSACPFLQQVLKVVNQCVAAEGVEASYIREEVLNPFFRNFWVARMALDRRNYRQLVDTTVAVAEKVGGAEVIGKIIEDLKDPNET